MQAFTFERPHTVQDALALLAGAPSRALAGGTDLIPQLREGRRSAAAVVDLKRIAELTIIHPGADGGFTVGAAASVRQLAAHSALVAAHPGVVEAARLIGSVQIQSRATLGGNLANGAPSADAVPLLVSLEAKAVVADAAGRRTVPVESLLAGPGRTTLQPGELIVSIELPPPAPRSAARYLRFTPRREMDIAVAGAGVALALASTGEIASVRMTLASVAPIPLRARSAEARLLGERPTAALLDEAARLAAGEARPISDTRASADYRRRLVAVLTRRALEACTVEAAASANGAPA